MNANGANINGAAWFALAGFILLSGMAVFWLVVGAADLLHHLSDNITDPDEEGGEHNAKEIQAQKGRQEL